MVSLKKLFTTNDYQLAFHIYKFIGLQKNVFICRICKATVFATRGYLLKSVKHIIHKERDRFKWDSFVKPVLRGNRIKRIRGWTVKWSLSLRGARGRNGIQHILVRDKMNIAEFFYTNPIPPNYRFPQKMSAVDDYLTQLSPHREETFK